MKLDRFINRPVLSTVISILIVILGLIGLATLPITQYPDIATPFGRWHPGKWRVPIPSVVQR